MLFSLPFDLFTSLSATLAIQNKNNIKMENASSKLLDFLKNNPNAHKETIAAGTGISGLHQFNILRKLQSEGKVICAEIDGNICYQLPTKTEEKTETLVEETTAVSTDENVTVADETSAPTQNTEISTEVKTDEIKTENKNFKQATIRDNSKYEFDGKMYGKGPLVHAVIKKYVADNPAVTYEQLKEIFPDTLMKRFGVFAKETEARSYSGKVNRYFLKEEQLIKLSDETIAVCNQWTAALINPFIDVCKNIDFVIT